MRVETSQIKAWPVAAALLLLAGLSACSPSEFQQAVELFPKGGGSYDHKPSQPPERLCTADDVFLDVGPYNVFTFGNYTGGNSDVEGRLAAGGDVTLWSYSVAVKDQGGEVLVCGGDVNISSAAIHGDVVYGGTYAAESVGLFGTAWQDDVIDFQQVEEAVSDASWDIWELPINGETDIKPWGAIALTGSDPDLNVFQLTAVELGLAVSFELNVPGGATTLINVTGGTYLELSNFGMFGTLDASRILFNAPTAHNVRIAGFGLMGSLWAPHADVDFDNGVMNGTLVAQRVNGDGLADGQPDGQMNLAPFAGQLCVD